jgi:hypothetical protein
MIAAASPEGRLDDLLEGDNAIRAQGGLAFPDER